MVENTRFRWTKASSNDETMVWKAPLYLVTSIARPRSPETMALDMVRISSARSLKLPRMDSKATFRKAFCRGKVSNSTSILPKASSVRAATTFFLVAIWPCTIAFTPSATAANFGFMAEELITTSISPASCAADIVSSWLSSSAIWLSASSTTVRSCHSTITPFVAPSASKCGVARKAMWRPPTGNLPSWGALSWVLMPRWRWGEATSEIQSHRDLPSFPTRRSSDLVGVKMRGGAEGHVAAAHGEFAVVAGLELVHDAALVGGVLVEHVHRFAQHLTRTEMRQVFADVGLDGLEHLVSGFVDKADHHVGIGHHDRVGDDRQRLHAVHVVPRRSCGGRFDVLGRRVHRFGPFGQSGRGGRADGLRLGGRGGFGRGGLKVGNGDRCGDCGGGRRARSAGLKGFGGGVFHRICPSHAAAMASVTPPRSVSDTSTEASSRIATRSAIRPMPAMTLRPVDLPNWLGRSTCAGGISRTSRTPSTISPIGASATSMTMITVRSSYSRWGMSKRRRTSISGMTLTRRLITPLM